MKIIKEKIEKHGLSDFHPKDRTSVAVIVTNNDNEYLIMQRSFEDTDGAGLWDIVGGSVDTHNPHECAVRELEEEAGINVESLEFFKDVPYHCPWINDKKLRLVFEIKTDQEPKVSFEHEQYKWIKIEELDKYEFFLDYLKQSIIDHNLETNK